MLMDGNIHSFVCIKAFKLLCLLPYHSQIIYFYVPKILKMWLFKNWKICWIGAFKL